MENRPVGRKKNVTEGGSGVHKRGEGLGTGPVGNSAGYSSGSSGSGGGEGPQRSGGRSPLFMIIIVLSEAAEDLRLSLEAEAAA